MLEASKLQTTARLVNIGGSAQVVTQKDVVTT